MCDRRLCSVPNAAGHLRALMTKTHLCIDVMQLEVEFGTGACLAGSLRNVDSEFYPYRRRRLGGREDG